jgi:hypothetical protein
MEDYPSDSTTNQLFVLNSQKKRGLVILVPITRIGAEAAEKWQDIVVTVNLSEVQTLVIIDKTPNQEASKYFKSISDNLSAELLILVRPIAEQYFDSMKYIKLDEQLWILQLHDDDAWEGKLKIPDQFDDQRIFLSSFVSVNKHRAIAITNTQSFPQRIIFSCLPAQIWNKFVNFIEHQGGHTAGSADSTLALIAYASSEFHLNKDFTYFYSTGNWDNRKFAQKHLTKLSLDDGWESLSSPRIAVMNRSIDNIAGLLFFRENIRRDIFEKTLESQIHSFRISRLKRVVFKFFVYVFGYLILPILNVLFTITLGSLSGKNHAVYVRASGIQNQFKLVLILDEIRDIQSLLNFIQNDLRNLNFPKLSERFDFWVSQISTYLYAV